MIPFERVTVGMLAWALDVETGEWGFREIVNTFESRSGDFLVRVGAGGGALTVTPEHPFWVLDGTSSHSGEWSAAAELGVGDLLISSEGEPVAVTTVSESAGGVAAHNFEVRGAHTYFVGGRGVLVHNACDESLTGDSGGGSVGNKPGSNTKVVNTPEKIANKPVKPKDAVDRWEDFLGEGPYTNIHPRTEAVDPDRLVSPDGTKSIRYGPHEMDSRPTKHHYHEETWTYDPATDTMTKPWFVSLSKRHFRMELEIRLLQSFDERKDGFYFDSIVGKGIGVFVSRKPHVIGEKLVVEADSGCVFELPENMLELEGDVLPCIRIRDRKNVLTGVVDEIHEEGTAVLLIGYSRFIFEFIGELKEGSILELALGPFDLYEVDL